MMIPVALLAGIIMAYALGVQPHWLWIASFVLLGMPHGAYDVWRLHDRCRRPAVAGLMILLYLVTVACSFCLWQQFPVSSLFLFLLLTASHWGIADSYWIDHTMNLRRVCLGTIRGIWIVSLPIATDFRGATQIMEEMVFQSSLRSFVFPKEWQMYFLLAGATCLMAEVIFHLRNRRYMTLGELTCLAVLAASLPSSLFLAAYFIAVHSWRYLYERFSIEGALFLSPTRWVIIAGISLVIIPVWYHLHASNSREFSGASLTASYLIVIAAFTLPHAILLQIQDSLPGPSHRMILPRGAL